MLTTIDNALQLRQTIEDAIADLIGTYTFTTGQSTPATAVLRGGEQFPPPGTVVEGLEVVIFYPELTPGDLLGGYVVENQWTIHLKQWDESKTTNEAFRGILSAIGNVKSSIKVPANKERNIPEMVRIVLHDFESIGGK